MSRRFSAFLTVLAGKVNGAGPVALLDLDYSRTPRTPADSWLVT